MALLVYQMITVMDPADESAAASFRLLKERKRIRGGIYGETGNTEYIRLLNEYVEDWGKGLVLLELYKDAAVAYRFAQAEARRTAVHENTDAARRLQYLTAKRFIDFTEEYKDVLPMNYQLTVAALKNETEELGESLGIEAEGK